LRWRPFPGTQGRLRALAAFLVVLLLAGAAHGVTWNGFYTFHEHADPNQDWSYLLDVHGTRAALSVDGFQTLLRYQCDVKTRGNSLDVIFRSATSRNVGSTYKPGTLLFILEWTPRGLHTRWAAMGPMLDASRKNPVAFRARGQ
jgi:hypothetical protein